MRLKLAGRGHISLPRSAALQLHFVPTGDVKVMTEEDLSTENYSNLNMR